MAFAAKTPAFWRAGFDLKLSARIAGEAFPGRTSSFFCSPAALNSNLVCSASEKISSCLDLIGSSGGVLGTFS